MSELWHAAPELGCRCVLNSCFSRRFPELLRRDSMWECKCQICQFALNLFCLVKMSVWTHVRIQQEKLEDSQRSATISLCVCHMWMAYRKNVWTQLSRHFPESMPENGSCVVMLMLPPLPGLKVAKASTSQLEAASSLQPVSLSQSWMFTTQQLTPHRSKFSLLTFPLPDVGSATIICGPTKCGHIDPHGYSPCSPWKYLKLLPFLDYWKTTNEIRKSNRISVVCVFAQC